MIRQISGTVLSADASAAVVEVHGFGVEVRMSAPETLAEGSSATLFTHLALSQDGMALYGFTVREDRDFFEKLISVSGIGPKTALSILRRSPREALMGAIGKRDLPYLTKVAGIGKKSAEKLMVELAEKMDGAVHDGADGEVFDTLVALGYTEREARAAMQRIPDDVSGKDARLKAALSAGA